MRYTIRLAFLLICPVIHSCKEVAHKKIAIGAASDLKPALDSIILSYKTQHPESGIEVSYGATGKIYEQILRGAPVDLFFSANREYAMRVESEKLAFNKPEHFSTARLVIWSRNRKADIRMLYDSSDNKLQKIAIANPEFAPFGKCAVEWLKNIHAYDSLKEKLIYGENVSQAAQFALSGAADAGIISLSLALTPAMKNSGGSYYLIPTDTYEAPEQYFVILKQSQHISEIEPLLDFLRSHVAAGILKNYGYEPANETF
jgi:molybdate transport system substrate-binding protein